MGARFMVDIEHVNSERRSLGKVLKEKLVSQPEWCENECCRSGDEMQFNPFPCERECPVAYGHADILKTGLHALPAKLLGRASML
jgi:hypothetical protein